MARDPGHTDSVILSFTNDSNRGVNRLVAGALFFVGPSALVVARSSNFPARPRPSEFPTHVPLLLPFQQRRHGIYSYGIGRDASLDDSVMLYFYYSGAR